jgi:ketopantoate reductase
MAVVDCATGGATSRSVWMLAYHFPADSLTVMFSLLTGATLDHIVREPSLRALCESMITETKAVNEALGIHIPMGMMDRRLQAAGSIVGHKMSMLQDLERGRSLEIDALVTAVQELGQLTRVATPVIDAVLALVKERGRRAGLYAPIGGTRGPDTADTVEQCQ